ncbi:uncharacterized protein M421DRAFT_416004 [Didymella exigua CBS 183.55]|uniref:Uncharacterized protein n=1 Tax=Didymella exigua CBS 183.55 TaxID=1150837 RepID=A0A6A5S1J6_9PLEO|nr:uncharacterized protein M421DRAFT_416004 [Didymella exigua CBS 183.55]KAF1933659.1 hypothetical protein M421DRAFT_416004 [Didymella exigua CBS 183.55]
MTGQQAVAAGKNAERITEDDRLSGGELKAHKVDVGVGSHGLSGFTVVGIWSSRSLWAGGRI